MPEPAPNLMKLFWYKIYSTLIIWLDFLVKILEYSKIYSKKVLWDWILVSRARARACSISSGKAWKFFKLVFFYLVVGTSIEKSYTRYRRCFRYVVVVGGGGGIAVEIRVQGFVSNSSLESKYFDEKKPKVFRHRRRLFSMNEPWCHFSCLGKSPASFFSHVWSSSKHHECPIESRS